MCAEELITSLARDLPWPRQAHRQAGAQAGRARDARSLIRATTREREKLDPEMPPLYFPDEVLEHVLVFLTSHKDRNEVSLVCRAWYKAERWSRKRLFIGNCYSVAPEAVTARFPRLTSVTLKGKPRFADFGLLPNDWGASIHPWVLAFARAYPGLEELRFKRMTVTDASLDLIGRSFPNFKLLVLTNCEGFSVKGLSSIARLCR